MSSLSRKGGISKQMQRKRAEAIERLRPRHHAGLPPAVYTALQNLPPPTAVDVGRASLQTKINNLVKKQDRIQKAFDATSEVIRKFQTNSKNYTDLLLVPDVLSSCLTDVGRKVTVLEEQLSSDAASASLAYTLQQKEIDTHLQTFGRLDVYLPQEERRPSRKGLSVRSTNVPSPVRPARGRQNDQEAGPSFFSPSQRATSRPLIQTTMPDFIPTASTPSVHNTAVLQTPEAEATYERCKHNRLIRLNLSAGQNAKKLLHESCRRQCGRSTDAFHTLWSQKTTKKADGLINAEAQAEGQLPSEGVPTYQDRKLTCVKEESPNEMGEQKIVEEIDISSSPVASGNSGPPTPPPSPISQSSQPAPPTPPLIQLDGNDNVVLEDMGSIKVFRPLQPASEALFPVRGGYRQVFPPSPNYSPSPRLGRPLSSGCGGRITPCPAGIQPHLLRGFCSCGLEQYGRTPTPRSLGGPTQASHNGPSSRFKGVAARLFRSPSV